MASDAREGVLKAVGDLSGYEVMFNQILVGTYVRPERTAGGLYLTQQTLKEDEYQGKVGLVLKMGPTAFKDTDTLDFAGQKVSVGDWIVYRTGDAWQMNVNGTACRMLVDRNIRMKITNPEGIF